MRQDTGGSIHQSPGLRRAPKLDITAPQPKCRLARPPAAGIELAPKLVGHFKGFGSGACVAIREIELPHPYQCVGPLRRDLCLRRGEENQPLAKRHTGLVVLV